MSAERLREEIHRVLREEYPNGATPSELRVHMARRSRVYTMANVKMAVTTLRRLRRVTFDIETQRLVATDPAELQRRAREALNEPEGSDGLGGLTR